jgi:hypothetical protein
MRRAALPPGWRAAPYHTRAVLHAIEWRRLVFDECHEAILLDNHKHMANFMRLRARNVWCVSGTPFVQNDVSMYGIHNLLGIRLKLHVSDTPFASVQSLQARHALMHAHASDPCRRAMHSCTHMRACHASRAYVRSAHANSSWHSEDNAHDPLSLGVAGASTLTPFRNFEAASLPEEHAGEYRSRVVPSGRQPAQCD